MAAYSTAQYDYNKGTSDLALNKGLSDAANEYGRFLSQQRFRRDQQDMGQQFKQNMPKVGSSYNRRGLWNSGLRRQGQRQFGEQYNQALQRSQFDQGAAEQQYTMTQTASDARYQQALLDLYEQFQSGRANTDPFANVYIPG